MASELAHRRNTSKESISSFLKVLVMCLSTKGSEAVHKQNTSKAFISLPKVLVMRSNSTK